MPTTKITNLNPDCLLNIFSFLTISEKIRAAEAWPGFWRICQNSIKTENIQMMDLCNIFSKTSLKNILAKIGPFTNKFSVSGVEIEHFNDLTELIINNFKNLKQLELIAYQDIDQCKWRNLLTSMQHLKIFELYGCDLSDEHCEFLSTLKSLEILRIEKCGIFSGKYLDRLTNLTELNLQEINGLEPEHFNKTFQSMQLVTLNIRKCSTLNNCTFIEIVKTQKFLETLVISNCYDANNLNIIANIESLKNLEIYRYSSYNCIELMQALGTFKRNTLESLQLHGFRVTMEDFTFNIMKMNKLKKFVITYDRSVDDIFLRKLSDKCIDLVEFSCSAARFITNRGLIDFIAHLEHLKVLNISLCKQIDEHFVLELIDLLKQKNRPHKLTLYIQYSGINTNIFKIRKYTENQHLLKIQNTGYPSFYRSYESLSDEQDYSDSEDSI